MELSLGIAIAMEVILITSLIYCLIQIKGCKKIIKQMIQLDNIQIGTKKNDINLIEKENSRYVSDSIKKIEKQIEHQDQGRVT